MSEINLDDDLCHATMQQGEKKQQTDGHTQIATNTNKRSSIRPNKLL